MGNRIQGLTQEFKPEKGAFVRKREALHSNGLYEKDKISIPKISSILAFDWNVRKRIR